MKYVYEMMCRRYEEDELQNLAMDYIDADGYREVFETIMSYYIDERKFSATEIADMISEYLFDYGGMSNLILHTLDDMKGYMTTKGWDCIGSEYFGIRAVDQ